eukprot:COSAG02_NODE_211_length_28730_cov_5.599490_29_plen_99_part_00
MSSSVVIPSRPDSSYMYTTPAMRTDVFPCTSGSSRRGLFALPYRSQYLYTFQKYTVHDESSAGTQTHGADERVAEASQAGSEFNSPESTERKHHQFHE